MSDTNLYQDAVARLLAEQPWWVRRKDTLAAIAGTILQVANLVLFYSESLPEWVPAAIAVIIGCCQVVIHAATPGAITPSMGERLAAVGDTPSAVGRHRAGE